jgi:hypothetical protein
LTEESPNFIDLMEKSMREVRDRGHQETRLYVSGVRWRHVETIVGRSLVTKVPGPLMLGGTDDAIQEWLASI